VTRRWLIVLLLSQAAASELAGQDARQRACAAELQRRTAEPAENPAEACAGLAGWLVDTLAEKVYQPPASAVQSRRTGEALPAGTTAQTEAVPGVQPTALASASLGITGSKVGTDALTSVSLNPATLFGGTDAEAIARWGRFTDVTVFFPVTDAGDIGKSLDYIGARVRMNITGVVDGGGLLDDAKRAFNAVLRTETNLLLDLTDALKSAPDAELCVRSALESKPGDRLEGCGGNMTIGLSPSAYRELRERLAAVREKADARYLGLDLRVESGDPTLGAVPGADVTALQAGVALGRRILQRDVYAPSLGIRSRLGIRYTDPRDPGTAVAWALDGGLGFDASRMLPTEQYVKLSAGFEFRYSNSDDAVQESLQTDLASFRGSLAIPLVGGASLSISFTTPVAGDTETSLTFNVDWGLLLPGLGGLLQEYRRGL
jgi:hypothetical protein